MEFCDVEATVDQVAASFNEEPEGNVREKLSELKSWAERVDTKLGTADFAKFAKFGKVPVLLLLHPRANKDETTTHIGRSIRIEWTPMMKS